MSVFQLNAVSTAQPATHVQQVQPPAPPKAQSDHKALNPATSSRGPAVVLSGGLAKAPDKAGHEVHAETASTGQHLNHVI